MASLKVFWTERHCFALPKARNKENVREWSLLRGQIKPCRDLSPLDVQQATPTFHMAVHCKFPFSQSGELDTHCAKRHIFATEFARIRIGTRGVYDNILRYSSTHDATYTSNILLRIWTVFSEFK